MTEARAPDPEIGLNAESNSIYDPLSDVDQNLTGWARSFSAFEAVNPMNASAIGCFSWS